MRRWNNNENKNSKESEDNDNETNNANSKDIGKIFIIFCNNLINFFFWVIDVCNLNIANTDAISRDADDTGKAYNVWFLGPKIGNWQLQPVATGISKKWLKTVENCVFTHKTDRFWRKIFGVILCDA